MDILDKKMKISGEQCFTVLKKHKRRMTAKEIAAELGSDSRAVATALRKFCDGRRVSQKYKKGIAHYLFERVK